MSEPGELFIPEGDKNKDSYVNKVLSSLDSYKSRVLNGEKILDRRNADGSPTTNYVKTSWFRRNRKFKPNEGYIDTTRYTENMLVAVKHNVPFFAVLPELVDSGTPILATTRDPVTTILSWEETRLPVAKGFMPSAQAYWPEINQLFENCQSDEIAWARIYDAFCQRILQYKLPLIKYEDIVNDVTIISNFVGRKSINDIEIKAKSASDYGGSQRAIAILDALIEHSPHALQIYPDLPERREQFN